MNRRSCSSTSRPPASTSSSGGTCGTLVRALRAQGVTIILTTHYIDEAEEMADRVGVISKGEIILVENKAELMRKLGKKQLTLHLQDTLARCSARARRLPSGAGERRQRPDLHLRHPGQAAQHRGAARGPRPTQASASRISQTTQSSLEDIFVSLVREGQ